MAVTFNGTLREIQVTNPADTNIDVEQDLYSAWKDWVRLSTANAGFPYAFRAVGGDPTVSGQTAPKFFFLQNLWKVRINNGESVNVATNLYTDDYITPYVVNPGSAVISTNSNAVTVATGGGGGGNTPQEIADAVWDALTSSYTTPGTMGESQQNPSISPTEVADAVWDATAASYVTPGSMGEVVQSPSGLTPTEAAQLQAIFDKLPADNEDMASTLEVSNLVGAGLSATQATQLATIFAKLPIDDISGVADVNALIGQGLTASEASWLQTIHTRLPNTNQKIAGVDDVSALSGDGLSAAQASQLQAIFDKLPAGLDNIASDANVTALIGQGLDATQASQLLAIFSKLPADTLSGVADVNALIGQGLDATEQSQLQSIFDKLPAGVDTIAGSSEVGAIDSPWTTVEKDQLIVDLETTKRQALKAANNTEAPE